MSTTSKQPKKRYYRPTGWTKYPPNHSWAGLPCYAGYEWCKKSDEGAKLFDAAKHEAFEATWEDLYFTVGSLSPGAPVDITVYAQATLARLCKEHNIPLNDAMVSIVYPWDLKDKDPKELGLT